MNVRILLDLLVEVEQKMDEFYTWCAREFRADSEAAGLFNRLSVEEKAHKNMILYQKRIANQNPNAYQDVNMDPSMIKRCISQVDFFQHKKTKSSVNEAIEFALQVESSAAESHFPNLIAKFNPQLTQLLAGLKAGDERHIGWLWDFAKARAK